VSNSEQLEASAGRFESLVAAYSHFVFRVAYSVLRNSHDAEDVVQETFLRVFRLGKLDEVREPRAWLAKIAWRIAITHSQSPPVDPLDDSEPDLPSSAPSPEQQAEARQRQAMLREMILSLPEELRHPLVLSTVEEMNSREIAEILGIPEGSVRTRLMRARELLKQKLAARLHTAGET